ncbi:hypothetical protein DFQ27_001679 [Actinomortierella ambigua]|uniref:Uncharacterized protein n=1 Tax=Actinomortierella ambigua TaxID=1343610 RepID=A0A9P6Q9F9_9FUNG|nr:hypothetical protein DFQ27_001679 [Actinomortierella ambigua]
MKITAAAAFLVSCMPSLGFALIRSDWNFARVPPDGLWDITFPFNMAKAPHRSGFYFAQQFNFHGVKEMGYTGLQPREDKKGKSIVHAAFSSFQGGTTTDHPNCHLGADFGPGVSCAVAIAGNYSHTYKITVRNIGGTTWRGTLIDTVTKERDIIGEWTLPSGSGKIVNGQMGFVEYYPWNTQRSHTCDSLPYTSAFFQHPYSRTKGAVDGRINRVYENGGCIGQVGYKVNRTSTGYNIEVGH